MICCGMVKRYHYLDFSRAFFLLLGVILHAAVFCENSVTAALIWETIHSFRLPGFFLLAGFFSALSLARSSPERFLLKRFFRLCVPLVSVTAINLLLNCGNRTNWQDFSREESFTYWWSGDWLQHLWFLSTLLTYVLILFLTVKAFPQLPKAIAEWRPSWAQIIILSGVVCFACVKLDKALALIGIQPSLLILDLFRTEKYPVYFGLGYILFHSKHLAASLHENPKKCVLGVLMFTTLCLADFPERKYLLQLVEPAYVVALSGVVFWFASRFVSESSILIKQLCDASYTIFLFHWPLQITLNRFFSTGASPALKFLVLVSAGFLIPFLLHRRFASSEFFRFLFNGEYSTDMPARVGVSCVKDPRCVTNERR
jgi:glucans biosynthesis protein C